MHPFFSSLAPAFTNLGLNPLRTMLSTLGIVMGAGALVSVLTMSDGVEDFVRIQLATTTDLHSIQVIPSTSRKLDGQTIPISDPLVLDREALTDLRRRLADLASVMPFYQGPAMIERAEGPGAVGLTGVETLPDSLAPLSSGRYPTDEELAANRPVGVIGSSLSGSLGVVPGDTVMVGGQPVTISGIWQGEAGDGGMLLPLEVARSLTAGNPPPTRVLMRARRIEGVDSAAALTRTWAGDNYGERSDELQILVSARRLKQARQGIRIFRLLMGAMTGVALLVGGVGIMNVLLASVAERTREIGIRKSVGARRRDILGQFLLESLVIATVGCIIGVALGWTVAYGVAIVMNSQTGAAIVPTLTVPTVVISMLVAASVGLAFGSYPALRAARLSPIDALRHE